MDRTIDLSVPEIAFVAATRGMAGAGIGLLASSYLSLPARKATGWTLLAIGALTTVPIAVTIYARRRRQETLSGPAPEALPMP
ncbi:MAG TPA: hypothetical protein VET86_06940 [Casimicrobiaceae bacterium]|nr:hypothetical protein [Casimicrobiaceae bacterium]